MSAVTISPRTLTNEMSVLHEAVTAATWREVKSSNIRRIGWIDEGMVVEYHNGGVYLYLGVSIQRAVATSLRGKYGQSVGKYINGIIKQDYRYVKLYDSGAF